MRLAGRGALADACASLGGGGPGELEDGLHPHLAALVLGLGLVEHDRQGVGPQALADVSLGRGGLHGQGEPTDERVEDVVEQPGLAGARRSVDPDMRTPGEHAADRGDDAPAREELGEDGFLPVHHVGELDEAGGLGVADGLGLVGLKALALGVDPLGLPRGDGALFVADEQAVTGMEQDLLAVHPATTATDSAGGEDAFAVAGLDERVGCGLPVGSFAGGEMSLPPVSTGEAEERQVLVVVGGQADDLLGGVWQVVVDALVVA